MTSISATSTAGMGMAPRPQAQPLSDEQKSLIEDTLKNFDPETLSQEDAISITEAFKEAGIQPGRELAEVMSEYDFDAKAVGEMAGVQPPPPPAPKSQSGSLDITDELLQNLNDLINDYYSDSLSEEERATTLDAIKDIFEQTTPEGGLVNTTA